MLDFNSTRMKRTHATGPIMDAIDGALLKEAALEPRREYVGASGIAAECERQIQFGFMGVPPDLDWTENPRFIRIRQRGHLAEDLAITWLEKAGFEFLPLTDNQQLRFHDAGGLFSGGCDGVIVSGPVEAAYPFLWEHKALGNKSWRQIDKRGLKKAKPIYHGQVCVYQGHLEYGNPALFQATNMDTMEIYFDWVDYDINLAQKMTDRAADIIADTRAGHLRPRISSNPDYFECKWCKWRNGCHNLEK